MENVYDIIIVGGGPAGMTAALYAARAGKKTLVLERMFFGGQMAVTPEVRNYPGSVSTSGAEIALKMQQQLKETSVVQKTESVIGFSRKDYIHEVKTISGEYLSSCVILALGAPPRKLGIEGEDTFSGAGVSYCATCDGNFFKNKDVAVVGGGNTAFDDAVYLSGLANKVYLIHRRDDFRALDTYIEKAREAENIEFMTPYAPKKITGDKKVGAIELENTKTGESKTITVSGVFVAVGATGNTAVLPEGTAVDKNGYILAGEDTKTNVPGVFAAGDVRKKSLRQIVTAVSDGANAAAAALEYLSDTVKKQ